MSTDTAALLFHVAALEARIERLEAAAASPAAGFPVFTAAEAAMLVTAVRGSADVPVAAVSDLPLPAGSH